MIGAILCGGFGKRLKPLTDHVPKPLLEIKDNYTILDRQLLQFKHAGIDRAVLLCGHLHEKIKERFQSQWNGLKIDYLVEDRPRGTLFAINNLLKNFDSGDYIIRNGDIVCDVNIKEMIRSHRNKMLMYITPLVSPFGIVELSDNKIIGFREKPRLNHYINAGIYIMSKDLKPILFEHEEGDIEKLTFPKISSSGLLNFYKEDVFWQSVDSIKDLETVKKEYENKEDKPWGYEKILVYTEKYLTKELYLMKSEGTSHHKHLQKDETMHITQGEVVIKFDDKEVNLKLHDKIRIKPNTPHAIHAVENTILHEYSTPHLNDTVRIVDQYERT